MLGGVLVTIHRKSMRSPSLGGHLPGSTPCNISLTLQLNACSPAGLNGRVSYRPVRQLGSRNVHLCPARPRRAARTPAADDHSPTNYTSAGHRWPIGRLITPGRDEIQRAKQHRPRPARRRNYSAFTELQDVIDVVYEPAERRVWPVGQPSRDGTRRDGSAAGAGRDGWWSLG